MKTEYKYIQMRNIITGKKTKQFQCVNIRTQNELGEVKWYPGWRQYCYFPTVQAVYSDGCLNDISDFIKQLMDEKKKLKG